MKIFKLLIVVLVAFVYYACSNETSHKINGYWQLQHVTYPNGKIEFVDTVFYAFQNQAVFSFTTLINADSTSISYGYLDLPEENQIYIKMDLNHSDPDFLTLSGWASTNETFVIDFQGNKMEMIDSQERVLQFKRF